MDHKVDEGIFIWLRSARVYEIGQDLPVQDITKIISDVQVFDDPDECTNFILSFPDEIFFLGLDYGRSYLANLLESIQQIHFIYLRERNQCISTMKLRGVMRDFNELLHQLQRDVRLSENRHTHLTTCEPDIIRAEASTQDLQKSLISFSWSQILLDMIVNMPQSTSEKNRDWLDEVRRLYRNDPFRMKQVDNFEHTYISTDAITCYTEASFLFKVINKALRTRNIIIIYKFRSFIRSIHQELRELQKKQLPIREPKILYRGQKISPSELVALQQCVGGLVSMNTFMSTSLNEEVARLFVDLEHKDMFFENVIFEYLIDPDLPFYDLPPFANIRHLSHNPDEEEVLLSMGTVARIDFIVPDETCNHIHRVRLHVCEPVSSSLLQFNKTLSKCMKVANLTEGDYIFELTNMLHLMGEYEKTEQLINLFLQRSDMELHPLQELLAALARFAQRASVFDGVESWMQVEAKKLFDKCRVILRNSAFPPLLQRLCDMTFSVLNSIDPFENTNDTNKDSSVVQQQLKETIQYIKDVQSMLGLYIPSHPMMAQIEHLLGDLQTYQGDHANAIKRYERAIALLDSISEKNHPLRRYILCSMADSVGRISGDDAGAQILHDSLIDTNNDALRVVALRLLANYHRKRKDWPAAIACYRDIIALPFLPRNSIEIVQAYYLIGDAFCLMGNIYEAMENLRCALALVHQHHLNNQSLLNDVQARIDHINRFLISIGQYISDKHP